MSDSTTDKRRRWREYHAMRQAVSEQWARRGYCYPPPVYQKMPLDLVGMQCGAKTKAGTPCKLTAIYLSGRCKWHGGLSTGPKTEEGKEQARINGRKGGRPRKPKL